MSTTDLWKDFTIEQLVIERKIRQDWIDGDENDGRLSTGSSAQLDMYCDEIDEINEMLIRKGVPPSV